MNPELPQRTVVVDANTIVHGAWRLDSPAWTVLLHQASSGHIRLVVPELVVREAVGRFRDAVRKSVEAVEVALGKLGRLTGGESAEADGRDADYLAGSYENYIRRRLTEFSVEVTPFPPIDSETLAQWAIDRRRPFDAKGSGFRDAILWEIVVRYATDGPVYLISNDISAFAADSADSQIHEDLVGDLMARDVTNGVQLFTKLDTYLSAAGVTDTTFLAHLFTDFQTSLNAMKESVHADLHGRTVFTSSSISVRVLHVRDSLINIAPVGAPFPDAGPVFIVLDVLAEVDLEYAADDAAAEISPSIFHLSGSATYDPASRTFGAPLVEAPEPHHSDDLVEALSKYQHPTAQWQMSPETFEALRRASEINIPPKTLEAFRRASQINIPPKTLEAFRHASQINIPPGFFEMLRKASGSAGPPPSGSEDSDEATDDSDDEQPDDPPEE